MEFEVFTRFEFRNLLRLYKYIKNILRLKMGDTILLKIKYDEDNIPTIQINKL